MRKILFLLGAVFALAFAPRDGDAPWTAALAGEHDTISKPTVVVHGATTINDTVWVVASWKRDTTFKDTTVWIGRDSLVAAYYAGTQLTTASKTNRLYQAVKDSAKVAAVVQPGNTRTFSMCGQVITKNADTLKHSWATRCAAWVRWRRPALTLTVDTLHVDSVTFRRTGDSSSTYVKVWYDTVTTWVPADSAYAEYFRVTRHPVGYALKFTNSHAVKDSTLLPSGAARGDSTYFRVCLTGKYWLNNGALAKSTRHCSSDTKYKR